METEVELISNRSALKKIGVIVAIINTLSYRLLAQPNLGLEFDPHSFAKIPHSVEQQSGSKDLNNYPLTKDLSSFAPTVVNQGSTPSCVAWSTAYYAYTIQVAARERITSSQVLNKLPLSAMYAYKQLQPYCTQGINLHDIADLIQKMGAVSLTDFPQVSCPILPLTQPQRLKTPYFPIKSYQALFDQNRDTPDQFVQAVLKRIGLYDTPVVVGLQVGDDFAAYRGSPAFYAPKFQVGSVPANHAMTVVGYDVRRNGFKLVNSFGSQWGQDGYCWIRFEDFKKIALAGFFLVLPDSPHQLTIAGQDNIELGGEFGFQYLPKGREVFQRVAPHHVGNGVYELDRTDWTVGQYFQLLTNNTRSGQSMCVFSVDADGDVKLHWPEPSKSDSNHTFGLGVTDILPVRNFDIVIPGVNKALVIEQTGTDFLCVVYSDQSLLTDLKASLDRIQHTPGDIISRIRAGFGSRLMDPTDVTYESHTMRFWASGKTGNTVPLILKIQSVPSH